MPPFQRLRISMFRSVRPYEATGMAVSALIAWGPAFWQGPECRAEVPSVDSSAQSQAVALVDDLFPVSLTHDHGGKSVELKLTGTAVRKAFAISFYRIAGYCDGAAAPTDA